VCEGEEEVTDKTTPTRLEAICARLEAVMARLEAYEGEADDLPETPPDAIEAAEKMVQKRRWEITGGVNGNNPDDEG
jgi:hypothetical protein